MAYYTFISRRGFVNPGLIESAIMFKIQLYKNLMMKKAVEYLRNVTPHGDTGKLKQNVTTWGMRIYSRYGFRFNLGWRKQDFRDAYYAPMVDRGSGIYGPRKTRIVPLQANRLVWQQGGVWKYAKSVRGQRPQGLITQAVQLFDDWFLIWLEKIRIDTYRKMVR